MDQYEAAASNNVNRLQYLISTGVDMGDFDSEARTPLFHAAEHDALEAASVIIHQQPETVAQLGYGGRTALHEAASYGALSVVQLLIQHGADVDAQDANDATGAPDWTPLHCAIRDDNVDVVKALLDHDADPFVEFQMGSRQDAFFWAAFAPAPKCLKLLLERYDVDVNRLEGPHPDKMVSMLHLTSQEGCCECMSLLLDCGGCVDLEANHASTPLHVAAQLGHAQLSEMLVWRGAKIERRNACGYTPTLLAAGSGSLDTLSCFLGCGTDHTVKAHNGFGLLEQCCRLCQSLSVCAFLLQELHFDPNGRREFRLGSVSSITTPLLAACQKGCAGTVQLLIEAGADVKLCGTVNDGSPDDLGATKHEGTSALTCAVNAGSFKSAEMLLHHGANPTCMSTFTGGTTRSPLSCAVTQELQQWDEIVEAEEYLPWCQLLMEGAVPLCLKELCI